MARTLSYRLSDPGYTIYHRAALGGLAATIQAWGSRLPEGIDASVDANEVRLGWGDDLTDRQATTRILGAAFRITPDKLIDLAGHQIPPDRDDLRVAVHNGLCATFLQHPKMRPSAEKAARYVSIQNPDNDEQIRFSYKCVDVYAHQRGQGTGLLDSPAGKSADAGSWPSRAQVPQSMVPGAMKGARSLEVAPEEALLLSFLMVGSAVFLLRPRTWKEKAQACVVVPDVVDLRRYARNLGRIATAGDRFLSGSYLGRVVGGLEEAALRFLFDLEGERLINPDQASVSGAQAIAMGKVSWDKNQLNRSFSVRLEGEYDEIGVFLAAQTHLGRAKPLRQKDGTGFAVPASSVPELVATNLGARRHWCSGFRDLVKERKEFSNILFQRKGLSKMKEAIDSKEDEAVIDTFQSAWHMTMGAMGERSRNEGVAFERLVEVERERVRNAILRAKTGEALANWFLRFCAEATRGNTLGMMRDRAPALRAFLFNSRNAERLQNLLLFALVSYAGESSRQTEGANPQMPKEA